MNEPSSLAKLPGGGGGGSGTLALPPQAHSLSLPFAFCRENWRKAPTMKFLVSNRDCLITIHITHRLFIGLQKAYTIYKS